jgi:hypothetical protein
MDPPGTLPWIDHMKYLVTGGVLNQKAPGILRFSFMLPGGSGMLFPRIMTGRASGQYQQKGNKKPVLSI